MLAIALLMAGSQPMPRLQGEILLRQATLMPKQLFDIAQRPSGTMFCDKGLHKRQGRRFDKRYGSRLNKLAQVIADRDGLGWSTYDGIIVTPCHKLSRAYAEKLLSDFEPALRSMEIKYGL